MELNKDGIQRRTLLLAMLNLQAKLSLTGHSLRLPCVFSVTKIGARKQTTC